MENTFILLLGLTVFLGTSAVNPCFDPTIDCATIDGKLWLSHCDITDEDVFSGGLASCLDAVGRENIRAIYLHENAMSSLPQGVFQGLTAMQTLSLHSNDLAILPRGVFRDLSALRVLFLHSNALTTLPKGVFLDLTALEVLNLAGNPLECLPATTLAVRDDDATSFTVYSDGVIVDTYSDECGCSVPGVLDNVCGGETCTPGPVGYACGVVTPAPVPAPTPPPTLEEEAPSPEPVPGPTPGPASDGLATPASVPAPTPPPSLEEEAPSSEPVPGPTPGPALDGCDEGSQGDAEGVQVCCPDDCGGVCDNNSGCGVDASCCPSRIVSSGVYCDTDGVSPPCVVGSASPTPTPSCCEQGPASMSTARWVVFGVAGVAFVALVVQKLRRNSKQKRPEEDNHEQRRNHLQDVLLRDEHHSVHVVVISCVELALSLINALEQDAFQLGSFSKLVFAASAGIEVYGLLFALGIIVFTEYAGGTPILCMWEAHSIESKWKSVLTMLQNQGAQSRSVSAQWTAFWKEEVQLIESKSKSRSDKLWKILLVAGVGPQVFGYWVCAFVNAYFVAPSDSFSVPEDVVSTNGLPFFGVLVYATLLACLVGLYRLLDACDFWGKKRDYFFAVSYSVFLLLILIEIAESFLIFSSGPASAASYMLAALDLFLAVPALFFVVKHMG